MTTTILTIAGSLRRESHNAALLDEVAKLATVSDLGVYVERCPVSIGDLPHYDADVEAAGDPAAVAAFKDAIRAADALLIATPEYNGGIPGVLKNALDWASRPAGTDLLKGKPAAVISASPARFGGQAARAAVVDVLQRCGAVVVPGPVVAIGQVDQPRASGRGLTSEAHIKEALLELLRRLGQQVEL